jgi:hypothetical protein
MCHLNGSQLRIVLNEHFEEDGAIVFREACKLKQLNRVWHLDV